MIFEAILTVLTITVALETFFLFFIYISINKNIQRIKVVEKSTEKILDDEAKTHTALIHIGHQVKTVQHDLDVLRKSVVLKSNGNGHPKAHA